MLCTIVTDASYCGKTKIAGWAAWIVCNNIRYKQFAAFNDVCQTSNEAEIKAAINGIYLARKFFPYATKFHLVVDSKAIIHIVESKKDKWWDLMKKTSENKDIVAKHVKAHSNGETRRILANRWCDKQARIAMKKKRKNV